MPKQKIAIISVLKPVDDVRSFEKMARSISDLENVELHLFGQQTNNTNPAPDLIHFHPHSADNLGLLIRWVIGIKILFGLFRVKPKTVICNTHELLIVTILCKILFGSKILYDIQENYYLNWAYQRNYPLLIRYPVAGYIRLKEFLLSPFFDHFILAEKTYQNEIIFISDRFTILENKALVPEGWKKQTQNTDSINLVFTGTITESNGIYRALEIYQKLRERNDNIHLHICGHCPSPSIQKYLNSVKGDSLKLDLSSTPTPHDQILDAIQNSDYGLVTYRTNESNKNCLPTKVYEYLALGLPIIYEKGSHWEALISKRSAGKSFAADLSDIDSIASSISEKPISLESQPADPEICWMKEKETLNLLILGLIK